MFMFPEPPSKEHSLARVNMNLTSSEQHTPFGFPRCTQSNFGLFARPIPDRSGNYEVRKVQDVILEKWTNDAKTWWIGKPGEDAQLLFELSQQSKINKEIDPRFVFQSSIFPRSYKYELDCLESRRHQLLLDKIALDETNEKNELKLRKEGNADIYQQIETDSKPTNTDGMVWHQVLGDESRADQCKHQRDFQKFRQPFKSDACSFYYKNYPPPPSQIHNQKFSK